MSGGGSFDGWYRAQHPRLFVSVLALTGDRELAADITDEALARALQHWRRVAEMQSPGGWTYRVALNLVRRHLRRARLERHLLSRVLPTREVAGPAGEVWALVRDLPERQRQVTVLRFVADLTESEIAQVLRISRGTVASTLAAARRTLREELTDDIVQES